MADKKTMIQSDVLAQLEIVQRRLAHVEDDMAKVAKQVEETKAIHAAEQGKRGKLNAIAKDKYKLDLAKVEVYLPRSKEWHERKKKLEKEMNRRAASDLAGRKRENSALDLVYGKKKESMENLQEKMDLLKSRL